MKRILILLLALVLILLIAFSTTRTDAPAYSATLSAEKKAIAAMYDQYGFTPETLGLFTVSTHTADKTACVHFYSELLPFSRVGQYTALIDGRNVTLTWTHDDKDTALYQSGAADAPYWGVRQLEAYLASDDRVAWSKDYHAPGEQDVYLPVSLWLDWELERLPEGKAVRPSKDVYAAAEAAIMDVYGLTAEDISSLEHDHDIAFTPDGYRYHNLTYSGQDLCFHVLIDTENKQIIDIALSSGGVG